MFQKYVTHCFKLAHIFLSNIVVQIRLSFDFLQISKSKKTTKELLKSQYTKHVKDLSLKCVRKQN